MVANNATMAWNHATMSRNNANAKKSQKRWSGMLQVPDPMAWNNANAPFQCGYRFEPMARNNATVLAHGLE